ncbi:N,N-dimethylformamidase beta subunit family domain-containing protein [Achromobacter aloeverae]|nr:N,N-dimethylformamidase beta subunit family domain-containing protein [Achromobacter aloeverae]
MTHHIISQHPDRSSVDAGFAVRPLSGPRQGARETWVEVPSQEGVAAAWCYSDHRSYLPNDVVRLHVSSNRDRVGLKIYREGAKRILVHQTGIHPASFHAVPDRAYERGCDWPVFSQWTIPADTPSGAYLVEVVDANDVPLGHHVFIVRALRKREHALVLVAATCTWAAYNDWGGANHYFGMHPDTPRGRAPILSAQRPWARGQAWLPPDAPRSVNTKRPDKAGPVRYEFIEWAAAHGFSKYYALAGWASYERLFLMWAEKHGYVVDLITQDDLHHDHGALDGYRCAVFVGHDEYWSREMRDHVDAFVEGGGNVARFAGNFMWQIRLEAGGTRQVAYKYDARTRDPLAATQPALMTSAWEDPLVNHPGASTFGVNGLRGIYAGFGGMARRGPRGFTVFRPEHWAFSGSGLGYADMFGDSVNIFGYEVDGLDYTFVDGRPEPLGTDGAPQGVEILAMGWATLSEAGRPEDAYSFMLGDRDTLFRASLLAPDATAESVQRHSRGSGMIVHFKKGAGQVFTAGTCEWIYGLSLGEEAAETITNNVLVRFLGLDR